MDLARDAVELLAVIHDRLACRHGDGFRALEQRIEALVEARGLFEIVAMRRAAGEALQFTLAPGPVIAGLVAEARKLGLIC